MSVQDDIEAEGARLDALEAAGICTLCEQRRTDGEDVFCAECRRMLTDTTSEVVDPVELVLGHHLLVHGPDRYRWSLCICGWSIDGGPGYHRRHVAAEIYSALGMSGPVPWIDGPKVVHPTPRAMTNGEG